jgi:hypothetical protein
MKGKLLSIVNFSGGVIATLLLIGACSSEPAGRVQPERAATTPTVSNTSRVATGDVNDRDLTAVEELLKFTQTDALIEYLSDEDEWHQYESLRKK